MDVRRAMKEVVMEATNPLTGLAVGLVPLEEVLGQPGVEFLRGISAGR